MSQQAAEHTVNLELSHDVALVLFELLAPIEEQRCYRQVVQNSAEVVALWNLSGLLESELAEPFHPNYADLLKDSSQRLVQGHDPDPLSLY